MSYLGTTKIGGMYLGSTEIAKAYLGSQLVFQKGGGSGDIWPPAGYTRLAALKRTNTNAYFNTGVIADSSTGCDIYFSNPDDWINANHAVFGIRRASGNGDANRYCLYTKTSATFAAHAVVFGPVDTSNIVGSGAATKWRGNLMKISVRGGKWYSWDRVIYDGSAQSFSNPDNTPVFLGLLAKNATTIYAASDFLASFHEAVFYDGQGVRTHRFLPYLNASNQMGFWDTVTGSFATVNSQSQWTPVYDYTLRSLRVRSRFEAIAGTDNYQCCVDKKGWQLAVCDGQQKFVLTDDTYEVHSGSTLTQTGRTLTCAEYNANWHGNAAWWSDTYADPSDYFPLLYVSTDKDNHLLTVYRLAGSDPNTCTISIVQKIYTPQGDSAYGSTLYFHNYYGCAGCNTFVQTAYTKNSYQSDTGAYEGNTVMYRIFNLPVLSAGSEVTLTEGDALSKGDLGFYVATSNGGWNGRYLYVTFQEALNIYLLTDTEAVLVAPVIFAQTSLADYIATTNAETEGFSWNAERECFTTMWEPANGNIMEAYADDLKPFVSGVYDWVTDSALPAGVVRVDYIESDGSAYIDTGVNLRRLNESIYGIAFSQAPSGTARVPYGIYFDVSGPRFQPEYVNTSGSWVDANTSHAQTGGATQGESVAASSQYILYAKQVQTYRTDDTMYFFARNNDSGSYTVAKDMRGYFLQIKVGAALVKDFIPVRVGGVGYLYDRIGRQLHGNIGGGAFVVGSDWQPVAPLSSEYTEVEYLTLPGTSYIDVGVRASDRCDYMRLDLQLTTVTAQMRLISNEGSANNANVYINGSLHFGYYYNNSWNGWNAPTYNTSRHVVAVDYWNKMLYFDNTSSAISSGSPSTAAPTVAIAGQLTGNPRLQARIYGGFFKRGWMVLRDVRFYRDASNNPYAYDRKSGIFLTIGGTGTTVGPDL